MHALSLPTHARLSRLPLAMGESVRLDTLLLIALAAARLSGQTKLREPTMVAYQVIGKPLGRVDGVEKVAGTARYAADVMLPGTIYGMSLKSPYAHARIKRIDTSAAKALPGVHAVITARTCVAPGSGAVSSRTFPCSPIGYVRWAGERVAAVAADDEDICQQALDLIEVEYEELTPLLDVEEAMKPDARSSTRTSTHTRASDPKQPPRTSTARPTTSRATSSRDSPRLTSSSKAPT